MTSPPGIWYLVDPSRGPPAPGPAQLQLETAPVGGTGPEETVLAARMNNDFSVFPDARFPVYTLSDHGHSGATPEATTAITEGATRAPVRGCVPFTGHRSSLQGGLKQGTALTSTPSGPS